MRQHLPDGELRARLARLDPIGDRPVGPASGPRAAEQMERAMQTLEPPPSLDDRRRSRRRLALAGGALVAAAAVGGGVYLAVDEPAAPAPDEPRTLALELPRSDAAAACAVFSEDRLGMMSVAFAGTVLSESADEVAIDVDRWFTGGDADQVRLESSGAGTGDTGPWDYSVDFTEGERYLVSAINGKVAACGLTTAATPDMEAAFERAFAG